MSKNSYLITFLDLEESTNPYNETNLLTALPTQAMCEVVDHDNQVDGAELVWRTLYEHAPSGAQSLLPEITTSAMIQAFDETFGPTTGYRAYQVMVKAYIDEKERG